MSALGACVACRHRGPQWETCPRCGFVGGWIGDARPAPLRPRALSSLPRVAVPRYATGITPLDAHLSGGLPAPWSVLLHGVTGTGKSVLAFGLAAGLAESRGKRSLYVDGEMGPTILMQTAEIARAADAAIDQCETESAQSALDTAAAGDWACVVYDSGGALGWEGGALNLVRLCKAARDLANERGHVAIVLGHATKRGKAAGPEAARHWVDASWKRVRLGVRLEKHRGAPVGLVKLGRWPDEG